MKFLLISSNLIIIHFVYLSLIVCNFKKVTLGDDTVQVDASTTKKPYLYGPDELTKLAKLEKKIYLNLQKCTESKLEIMNKWISDYEETSNKAAIPGNVKGFDNSTKAEDIIAGHPLLTYRMIRRYTNEFQNILRYYQSSSEIPSSASQLKSFIQLEKMLRYGWPTNEDLKDAMNSILKIQDICNFTSSEIVQGSFSDIETGIHLHLQDVVEIAKFAVSTNQFILGLEWYNLASDIINKTLLDMQKNDQCTISIQHIKSEITKLIDKHNDNWKAHSFGPGAEQMNYYVKKLQNETSANHIRTVKELGFKLVKGNRSQASDLIDYYAVCAGENLQTLEEISQLKCWYESQKSKELLVFPAKIEQLSKDPPLFKIHDAVGPKVANKIKQLSLTTQYVEIYRPKLNSANQELAYFKSRASANSWVPETSDLSLHYLSRRIESITGLNVVGETASDHFEVVAYSCGGNFVLHKDALEENQSELRGDRISTVLFYLDNVILGGRTAFPRIGTAIQPEAGTALLWYNLFPDGSVDDRTAHAACPVVLGHKWSVNKCITEHGNFLKRKCDSSIASKTASRS